jgi:hypothetical protein
VTLEERKEAFIAAMAEVELKFGFTVMPHLAAERLGEVLQTRAQLRFDPLPGWTEPPHDD